MPARLVARSPASPGYGWDAIGTMMERLKPTLGTFLGQIVVKLSLRNKMTFQLITLFIIAHLFR
jgi:hypothetical protein